MPPPLDAVVVVAGAVVFVVVVALVVVVGVAVVVGVEPPLRGQVEPRTVWIQAAVASGNSQTYKSTC